MDNARSIQASCLIEPIEVACCRVPLLLPACFSLLQKAFFFIVPTRFDREYNIYIYFGTYSGFKSGPCTHLVSNSRTLGDFELESVAIWLFISHSKVTTRNTRSPHA